MAYATQQAARDAVRALLRDGMPSYASSPFGLVRQEQVTQQIPAQATPTQTEFYVTFSSVPLGKNITVYAVPATIAAYRDSATTPDTIANSKVTQDIDQNGNFVLQTAPVTSLLVTYGWQLFADGDIDQHIAQANSWLYAWVDSGGITAIPDQLNHALALYAASQAASGIARQLALPDVSAGEAKESLSGVAKQYAADAKAWLGEAQQARQDFWTSADQPKQPAAATVAVRYPAYQPKR
jgi:hypothetical protein